jgi:hypothetical protein
MKISRSSSTEKLEMSLRDCIIVLRRNCSFVHDLASLKILRSRKALNAEIAPPPPTEESSDEERGRAYVTTTSTTERDTMMASKMLYLSLMYN